MQGKSIGTVARESNVAASKIRYYERIGLLPAPERQSGQRRYDVSIFWRLKLIRLTQRAGFSLGEIKNLLYSFPVGTLPLERWRGISRDKIARIDARIADLVSMKAMLLGTLRCSCASLDRCVAGTCRDTPTERDTLCCAPASAGVQVSITLK